AGIQNDKTKLLSFSNFIAGGICRYITQNFDALHGYIENALLKEIDPKLQLKDMYNKAIPELFSKNYSAICSKVQGYTAENRSSIKKYINAEIMKSLDTGTFLNDLTNMLVEKNYKADIDSIIDIIIDDELLPYLLRKKDFALNLISKMLECTVLDIGFKGNIFNKTALQKNIECLLASDPHKNIMLNFINQKINAIFAMPLDDLLKKAGFGSVENFSSKLQEIPDTKTIDTVLQEFIVEPAFKLCKTKFKTLPDDIDVRKLVEQEVNAMSPQKIEKVFYKFAGVYFKKITFYGWIGLFGGIAGYFLAYILNHF
ncbi:MAG: hypothetical protein LBV52_05660, partial [Spirochaetaceae bacterium]|nr:hypothetical protein [Spirochaetaceae bacterium]